MTRIAGFFFFALCCFLQTSHQYICYFATLICISDKGTGGLILRITQLLTLVRFKDDNLEIKGTLLLAVEVGNFGI